MNILVIGLGSMGKRRIRLIQKFTAKHQIVGVDGKKDRRDEVKVTFGVDSFESINQALKAFSPICAFVCTSPLSHASLIKECLENDISVFTELNLVEDGYEQNIVLAKKKGLKLFLSSTLLYRNEVSYIRKSVKDNGSMVNYTYHVGQYLPDWHPWESYSSFFIGDKRTNGCREILAIELPWLIAVFGPITEIKVEKSKLTNLNIDYPDNMMMLIKHENGSCGLLAVDVVSRIAVRNFEAYNEKLRLVWDGTPAGLSEFKLDSRKMEKVDLYPNVDYLNGYAQNIIENAYYSEIEDFFITLSNGKKQEYGFEEDLSTLKLIDAIEGNK